MKDLSVAFDYDLQNIDRPKWRERVTDLAHEYGQAEPIGPDHTALLIDGSRSLLVSFETVSGVRGSNDDAAPIGWSFVQSHGWSSLTILSDNEVDWFRDPRVFGYMDRLIDDGFFDDFNNVLFYGAGPAGYAAAAFSVAAPDSRVLAIQPQATLDPARARWDRRFPETRRMDFKSRFGYAPQMVETAEQVWILHDPSIIEDAMHAQLFNGENTTHLTCPYVGPTASNALKGMDILEDLIEGAMTSNINRDYFAKLWRARQSHMPYLRTLLYRLEAEGRHDRMLLRLCRRVAAHGNRPLFAKKLAELEARGVTL